MKTFKEYLTEILDSEFEVYKDKHLVDNLNKYLGDKVHSGHTAILHSDHMRKNGNSVLRLMNKDKEIEYHFLNHKGAFTDHKLDNKSMLHAMKIIHDDSKDYITKGHKIKLQSANDKQHNNYKRFSQSLVKKLGVDRNVVDKGKTDRLDGEGKASTIMIESNSNVMDWNSIINSIKEEP